jgi:hypothetical protein
MVNLCKLLTALGHINRTWRDIIVGMKYVSSNGWVFRYRLTSPSSDVFLGGPAASPSNHALGPAPALPNNVWVKCV